MFSKRTSISGIAVLLALLLVVVAWPGHTQGTHSINLTWNASSSATSYNIKRSTTMGTETLLQSDVTTTTFSDTNGTAGTKYFYVVTAVNQFGESGPSNEVSATFLGNPPAAPAGLSAVAQ